MRENNKISRAKRTEDKIFKYSAIGLSILAVIVFSIFMYSQSLNSKNDSSLLESDQIASVLDNNDDYENVTKSEVTSSSIGKSVEEQTNNTTLTIPKNTIKETNNTVNKTKETDNKVNKEIETNVNAENTENTEKKEEKELSFEKPVDGEVTRDFSKDNLVYSETLKEWVTHMGVDIKADKATVVKAAEAGTVKTIKNDPRFGLTVVIEHEDGFQTVYSNLLTSEFVVEGESIEKGQSIGTVGNTAIFEIVDEPHLHFEILKDSVQVDPNLYLK